MKIITTPIRLIYIVYIFQKYKLFSLINDAGYLKFLRLFYYINIFRIFFKKNKNSRAVNIRLALEKLGPIYIKFGQALSTRPDLIPQDIAKELLELQDNVPAFCSQQALSIVEQSLNMSIDTAYKSFDITPLASASVAQVHIAYLHTGEKVAVKIIRPNIKNIMLKDIHIMYMFANLLVKFIPNLSRLKPLEVVDEIGRNLINELDLMRESSNATQLKRNSEKLNLMYVPEIFWDYCRTDIMTMEFVSGVNSNNIELMKSKNTNMELLAKRGVEIFYSQVFDDCFFHADMHAGNIFVNLNDPQDPKYIAVDFGIVGTLSKEDQYYLAGNFLAFFQRDYRKVAQLHIDSNWVPANTRVDILESAIRTVCEPIFEKPLKDISFGQTLFKLFQIAQEFNMVVQPQLILLQKTLLNVEGMGRQIYPDLNLWDTAKPFLEKWMKSQLGLKGFVKRTQQQLPLLSHHLPEIPSLLIHLLEEKRREKQKEITKPKTKHINLFQILILIFFIFFTTITIINNIDDIMPFFNQYSIILSIITGCILVIKFFKSK